MLIEGLEEAPPRVREDLHLTISGLFEAMGVNRRVDYDQVYRVGPYQEKRVRPLFVSFLKMEDRNFIYSQRSNLKKSPNHFKVWVNDDITPETRRHRNVVRQLTRDAKEAGARCSSTQQAIIINGARYDLTNLRTHPTEFSLENVKTRQVNDGDLAYHSEHSPFSNLYQCSIFVGKIEFSSVEQVLHFKKAKLLNRSDVMQSIKLSRDGYEIRQLGKELGDLPEWDAKVEDVMFAAMLRKFGENEGLRDKLLATGNKCLVEATPDKKWGAGVAITSKAIQSGTWPGENRQGVLLMQVRDKLRAENKSGASDIA